MNMSICIVKGNDNAKRIYEKMGAKHYKDFIDYFGDTESNSEKLIPIFLFTIMVPIMPKSGVMMSTAIRAFRCV